jgi:hypothetical protein
MAMGLKILKRLIKKLIDLSEKAPFIFLSRCLDCNSMRFIFPGYPGSVSIHVRL